MNLPTPPCLLGYPHSVGRFSEDLANVDLHLLRLIAERRRQIEALEQEIAEIEEHRRHCRL